MKARLIALLLILTLLPAAALAAVCPNCSGEIANEKALFCGHCGASLATEWTCPSCGEKVSNDFAFCIYCGTARAGEAAQPAVTAAPAPKPASAKAPWKGDPTKVGSIVRFGEFGEIKYSQASKSPIEWLVLDYDAEKHQALLLSLFALDARKFHNKYPYPTWEKSDIRAWLNHDFLRAAFSEEEQAWIRDSLIHTEGNDAWLALARERGWKSETRVKGGNDTTDKLFLLSLDEVLRYAGYISLGQYYDDDRCDALKCLPTDYARSRKAERYDGNDLRYKLNGSATCWWWLRTPGSLPNYACNISFSGGLEFHYVNVGKGAVRPALWLKVE